MVLAFRHLDFNCHLDFGIWNLDGRLTTYFPSVIARYDSAEAISVGLTRHCEAVEVSRSNLGGATVNATQLLRNAGK